MPTGHVIPEVIVVELTVIRLIHGVYGILLRILELVTCHFYFMI